MAATEGATESIDSITFSFLMDEEVRKHSFVKITNPRLLDLMERPIPGGLYDPALGPPNERTICKTCGQRFSNCPGHCGHIDLVSPIYNPLLFNSLHKLLQRMCFSCCHFKAERGQVEKCIKQLELIIKGDIVGAKRLESVSPSEALYPEESDGSDGSEDSSSTIYSGAKCHDGESVRQQGWTSLQYKEATSVLDNFLKPNPKKCKNCKQTNPDISKPTFGWFHVGRMSDANIRANVITAHQLGGPSDYEIEGTTDAEDYAKPDNQSTDMKRHKKKVKQEDSFSKQKKSVSKQLLPSEVKEKLELLWENEPDLCSFMSDLRQQWSDKKYAGPYMFFLETILVPPTKFRPPTKGGHSVMEHPQTVLLSKVIESNIYLGDAHINKEHNKIITRWMDLQASVNILFDNKSMKGSQGEAAPGICQLLEKKEGLFRQKMMGKRVNYACRSVISPDPYLGVNEIGIPPCFAVKLTYPERVTPWNISKLRSAVINGPENHPGATQYVDKLSTNRLPPSRKARISISRKLPSTRGAVAEHGKSSDFECEGKIVYRHIQDGDVVLVNRQPTLHKPSIMAHVVRVLKGEKTLRMHYANCSTYNADFDGDEMNVHFPQDEVSRAEAYNIVNANNQYVRPSNGEPLRGLIQDHIVSAVLLTKKDTFLSQDEFNQLLYSSGVSTAGANCFHGKPGQKVLWSRSEDEIQILPPAIWKPEPLWTGKQVITAILNHITKGHTSFTVEKEAKIPPNFFKSKATEYKPSKEENYNENAEDNRDNNEDQKNDKYKKKKSDKGTGKKSYEDNPTNMEPGEEKMLVYKNELVRGVIDKAQFGEYGLVHTVHELLGSNTAGILLSVLSRLFTAYLQMHGFTCGVDDLLIMKTKDEERKKHLELCEKSGEAIHRNFIGIMDEKIKMDPVTMQLSIEKIIRSDGDAALAYLDRQMSNELNTNTSSDIISNLLSDGLLKPSGKNCISLMTTSGAKGSKVNFQQISSFLGQQELEGKRVPRMVSGKTLPSFHPWDWAARSGGYIIDRFLTGLRPQEYYFHCMAGREGLVDTAVKTSRSGYLQRCLIKNLECLKIGYDFTVRDADGSIVQFYYGEDGIDVHKTSFVAKFEELALNQDMLQESCGGQLGTFNTYISELPEALKDKAERFLDNFPLMGRVASNLVKRENLYNLMKQKFLLSLAQPGEPVGVLAAQSVGEPSTQMTLNTFHLAGRGEMNVTLGIPRLQEILMTASVDIKTPIMTCPLQEGRTKDDAERLADKLKVVTVADIVESMEVSVLPFSIQDGAICRIYKLKMKLHIPAHYPQYAEISVEDWEETLDVSFVRALEDAIQKHMILLSKISGIKFLLESRSMAGEVDEDAADDISRKGKNDDAAAADDDAGETGDDLGMDVQKRKLQGTDEMDYDDLGLDKQKKKPQATDEMDHTDCLEVELNEEDSTVSEESAGFESEIDQGDNETEVNKDAVLDNEAAETIHHEKLSKPKLRNKASEPKPKLLDKKKKAKAKRVRTLKDYDRAVFAEAKKMHFEVHFKFTNEPHILLAEIAQNTAKKVYIQHPGEIKQCRVTDCKENQVIYYGKDPKERIDIKPDEKAKLPALHATGVDFTTFWKMEDRLDVRYIYSNSIHAMLKTFGIEAARETIIREINHVFKSYGISVSNRHLSLIADYMTHSGGYRPMSRLGGIAESISPLSKMTFETASKFIVEAALHSEVDNLETPSARICVGLPVKMGTGSFDLMQKLEI
ncbi:DNA-directed RNA polymerase I subunit 1 [Mercurialis annua]|uniref:DNA-directed RNA polymerase I subunit 1 n=1 Tax=Mercurialis annua TaxID=3986 RepID=UPI00215E238D|nr:DNA-directed RNA polymerase I subunit 1 [Mercurialis annua]